MIRINNLAIPFDDKSDLKKTVAKRLKLPLQAVLEVVVVRKAIDARRRNNSKINFVYSLDVKISENEQKLINKFKKDNPKTRILQVMPYFDGVSESVAILYIANIY